MKGWIAGLALAAAGLLGCTTIDTGYSSVDADYSNYHTFAQAPVPTELPTGLPGFNPIIVSNIQTYIANTLEQKGFRMVSMDDADVVVRFSVSGKPQTDVWGTSGYGWYGGGGTVQTTHYVLGTMVIDIFDTEKKKLVWHGWGSAKLFVSQADGSLAPKAVTKILSTFPPDE